MLVALSLGLFLYDKQRRLKAADFAIEPTEVSLNSELTISGSGLNSTSTYYILAENAGPFFSAYGMSEYQGQPAAHITETRNISSTPLDDYSAYRYWAYNYDSFDKVVFEVKYLDNASSASLFTLVNHDIDASTTDITDSCSFEGTGSDTWITSYCVMEKNTGVTYKFSRIEPNTSDLYVASLKKFVAWEVDLAGNGEFEKVIPSPRRHCIDVDGTEPSFSNDCSYSLLEFETNSLETIGNISLNWDLKNYREFRDIMNFKYGTIANQDLDTNVGTMYGTKVFFTDHFTPISSWDLGYLGGIFHELNLEEEENKFYNRLPSVYGPNGEFLDLRYQDSSWDATLGDTSNNNIAAYYYLFDKYENGDTEVKELLDKIINYTSESYDSQTGLASTSIVRDPTRIWIDVLGIGKIEYMYKYGMEFGTQDADYARDTLEFIVDNMQLEDGSFVHDYDWDTDEIDTVDPDYIFRTEDQWWSLNQSWALLGLIGMQELFEEYGETDSDLINKTDQSMKDLLDHILSRDPARFGSPSRMPVFLAALDKIYEQDDYNQYQGAIEVISEQLLYESIQNYRVEGPLPTFGYIYSADYDSPEASQWVANTYVFPDLYLLDYISENSLADTYIVPNSSASPIPFEINTSSDSIYSVYKREGGFRVSEPVDWEEVTNINFSSSAESEINIIGQVPSGDIYKLEPTSNSILTLSGTIAGFTQLSTNSYEFTLEGTGDVSTTLELTGLTVGEEVELLKNGSQISQYSIDSTGNITIAVNGEGSYVLQEYEEVQDNPDSSESSSSPNNAPDSGSDSANESSDLSDSNSVAADSNLEVNSEPANVASNVEDGGKSEIQSLPDTGILDSERGIWISYAVLVLVLSLVIAFTQIELLSNEEWNFMIQNRNQEKRNNLLERFEKKIIDRLKRN
jgi:hypothetical protein